MTYFLSAKDADELTEILTYLKELGGKLIGGNMTVAAYVKKWGHHRMVRYQTHDQYVCSYHVNYGWKTLSLVQLKKMVEEAKRPFVKSRPSFYMGFEIEGCVDESVRNDLINYICDLYPGEELDDLIHYDGSIRPKCRAIEIVTPPLPETQAIERLEWLFGMLSVLSDEKLFETNGSCGFHINLSEKKSFHHANSAARAKFTYEFMNRIDPNKWRQAFGRRRNKYCWWTRGPKSIDDIKLDGPTFDAAARFGESVAKARHWSAINTAHLDADGRESRRVEVRVAGGKNYHVKTDTMRDFLLDIRGAMAQAYDSI